MHELESFFSPKSVAVVGASRDEISVGYGILKNLTTGCYLKTKYCHPFLGKIYPVNPNADEIAGLKSYPNLKSIKEDIDLVVIAVPAKIVPEIMKECASLKLKRVIIVSAGFSETGEEKLQEDIKKIAERAKIRVIGPNCLGIIRPSNNLNASFGPTMPPEGNIAFISQSGALADSIIDWSVEERYGFSAIISLGNRMDLDFSDFLEFLMEDEKTKAITLYIEGVDDGRKLMETMEKVNSVKPVIVLKSGRGEDGKNAIASHTGSLAGSYKIFETAMKQAGVIVADTVEEMFDIAKAVANQPKCEENSIAVVSNAGGPAVLTADYCGELGVNLAELKASTIKRLEQSGKMHESYSGRNPLDLVGDALPAQYDAAINILLEEDYISGVIVIQTLQTMTDTENNAKVVVEAKKKFPKKPIVCTYMGGKFSKRGVEILDENKIPDFNDPKKAVRAMKALIEMKSVSEE